jgi:hypothetical protein
MVDVPFPDRAGRFVSFALDAGRSGAGSSATGAGPAPPASAASGRIAFGSFFLFMVTQLA